MFRIESIQFNHGEEIQKYDFTMNTFVYGENTVGKTALTKAIDFVLGESKGLNYQGLDNIDSIEALLKNDNTELYIKRSILSEYYYKRNGDSEYISVSNYTYKQNICQLLDNGVNEHYMNVYEKIFDERPTFRAFSFLNFLEEKGLGDLSTIFTKAKEIKHQVRIRDIMNFLFNYANIEQLFELKKQLEEKETKYNDLKAKYIDFNDKRNKVEKIFGELDLTYKGKFGKDFDTFTKYKEHFARNEGNKSVDLVYLAKASYSLSEELKILTYLGKQTENTVERKEKIVKLLSVMDYIINDNPTYMEYTNAIKSYIERIKEDNIIISSTDHSAAVRKLKKEKNKIDTELKKLTFQAKEIDYDVAIKKIGILEDCFSFLQQEVDVTEIIDLEKTIKELKKQIKELSSNYDKKSVNAFNKKLNEMYLNNSLDIRHLNQDREDDGFKIVYDPFRLILVSQHKVGDSEEVYFPGSMTRQTHIQILTYLCMFDYLKTNFAGLNYLPVLIIDSANQPMGNDVFEKVYPSILEISNEIGLQIIFLSKEKVNCINKNDLIDISDGLNRFHIHKEP